MLLAVQQLNADTTFLLTIFNPTDSDYNYSILIDPWLTGPSPIFHSSFAVSRHTTESAIQSLTELSKPPDLIIVSQPKNDHCNRETLCTLPKTWKGDIVAVPAAAKKIRSWKHFTNGQVRTVPAYDYKEETTIVSWPLQSASLGHISIANIPEPYDMSAVHNAIGITYHPPPSRSQSAPLQIVYAPHGLTSSFLEPYKTHHLHDTAVDLLFHSLNTEANPKLLGGVVSNGAPGGVAIAKMLRPRRWVGAHDEVKENAGLATKLIRSRVYDLDDVEAMLRREGVLGTRVSCLGVGETWFLSSEGDADDWESRQIYKERQGSPRWKANAHGWRGFLLRT